MKRKKSTLTPCEEKALVTLQAQQIKEKEKKAKERAKKRKIDGVGRQVLAGQSMPSTGNIGTAEQTQPLESFSNSKTGPTRNEWDQLIPMGLQTAQFMILNHAMNRQGQWNQPQAQREVRQPIIPPPPRDVPDIAIVEDGGGIRLGRRVNRGVNSGRLSRYWEMTKAGSSTVGRGVVRGVKATGRGLLRGAKVIGGGFLSGAKAVGRGAEFLANTAVDAMELQREIEMTSIQSKNNDILMDGRRVAGTKINEGVNSGPLTKIANAARKIKSKLSPSGGNSIEMTRLFNDSTQPNNQPNEIFNNMNKPNNEPNISTVTQSAQNVSSSSSQNSSSVQTPKKPSENVSTPKKPSNQMEIGQFAGLGSPFLKLTDPEQGFQTKSVKGDNVSNTVKHLLNNSPEYRSSVYNNTVKQYSNQTKKGSLRYPELGVDPYVKLDNMFYLNQKGEIVYRKDPSALHPSLSGSKYDLSRNHAGSLRLQNKDVVNYFSDPDNVETVKELYKKFQSPGKQFNQEPLPITNAHAVDPNGIVSYNTDVNYDPEASNEEFNELYTQPDVIDEYVQPEFIE